MKLHPRVMPWQRAHYDIAAAVLEAMRKHPDLTYIELFQIFNEITASWLEYALRDERHPNDPEKREGRNERTKRAGFCGLCPHQR